LAAELDESSPARRQALASALEQAAARTANRDPQLAQALSTLAQHIQQGTTGTEAQRAASQAGEAIDQSARQSARQLAWQQALEQALNQAQASQRLIAQAAGQGAATAGRGEQAPGQSTRSGQGQAGGRDANQAGGGGGTNVDRLPPDVRTGTAPSPSGPARSFETGHIDTIYAPRPAGQGRPEFVGGSQGSPGQVTTVDQPLPQPGSASPALQPYEQVYSRYTQIAARAMERAYIPASLQDYVKDYFSQLEP
jgi:hypothetical protein